MKEKLWFRAKTYGWGWYPTAWQGWAVIVLYIVGLAINFFVIDSLVVSDETAALIFVPNVILLTIFLIIISYATGEKPEWRWGAKKTDNGSDKN